MTDEDGVVTLGQLWDGQVTGVQVGEPTTPVGGVALHRVDDQPGPGADGAVVAPTDTDTIT